MPTDAMTLLPWLMLALLGLAALAAWLRRKRSFQSHLPQHLASGLGGKPDGRRDQPNTCCARHSVSDQLAATG